MRPKPLYRMNDGVAYVFEKLGSNGLPPIPIEGGGVFFYEELSIGADDYQVAKGEQAQLTMRIRIHRQEKITSLNIVKLKGLYYEIWRVRHTVNRRGVRVTDITLAAAIEEAGE